VRQPAALRKNAFVLGGLEGVDHRLRISADFEYFWTTRRRELARLLKKAFQERLVPASQLPNHR